MIPCDEQLCSFPTLSEQESTQARQMDRGEIEVEEERRVRMKRVPVLPTDKTRQDNNSTESKVTRVALSSYKKVPVAFGD